MPRNGESRTIVITGASAGVGRAAARAFALEGCRVGLIARGEQGLRCAQADVERLGGQAVTAVADVADAEQVEAAAARMEAAFGSIDVWVNNAMTSVFAPFKETSAEEFHRVTEVTYLGVVYGTMAALRRMLPRDHGKIVQVGSALAFRGIPLQSAYCGAKHAIQGFTESLITELMHDDSKIKITMVHMPALNTPQFDWVKSKLTNRAQPVPPIFQPEVAADAIVWASKHDRREMYVGWPTVKAIWGNRVAPWYADRVLADMGYAAQQTQEPERADRPSNLWQPVDAEEDYGAHGRFDARSTGWSAVLTMSKHRKAIAAAAGGFALAGLIAAVRR